MHGEFFDLQLKDIVNILILLATIIAIYIGPLRAVIISRQNQEVDGKRARQFGVLHSLMKTRKARLSPEHVSAINLVQLEFYGNERIQSRYKNYIGFLNGVWPKFDDDNWPRFNEAVEDSLFDLIHEIGLVLGYTLDRQELMRLGYGPQGWETDEHQVRVLRRLLIETFEGRRGLPVLDFSNTSKLTGKFPPPPG